MGEASRFIALASVSSHLPAAVGHSQHGSSHHRSTHRNRDWFVRQPQAKAAASCDDHLVADLARTATELVAKHSAVRHVELAGSRSRGTHAELSDWDFAVRTSDFAAVARDLPALIAPLHPLGQQWEPLGHFPVYQVLLPGPTKVEYLFLDHSQQALPAPKPGPATLDAINTHFWDWIWWIATKASIGRNDLVAEHLP